MPWPACLIYVHADCITACCRCWTLYWNNRWVSASLRLRSRIPTSGRQEKPVSPGFLFAALLWHEVVAAWNVREAAGEKLILLYIRRWMMCWRYKTDNLAIPRRYDAVVKEIWAMQPRFTGRSGAGRFVCWNIPVFAPRMTSCCCVARAARSIWSWASGGKHSRMRSRATRSHASQG